MRISYADIAVQNIYENAMMVWLSYLIHFSQLFPYVKNGVLSYKTNYGFILRCEEHQWCTIQVVNHLHWRWRRIFLGAIPYVI
jgi:hypothetical protein